MNKIIRKITAVLVSLIVFYILSSYLFNLYIKYRPFDVVSILGEKNIVKTPAFWYMFVVMLPFSLTNIAGSFMGGIAGLLTLGERKYLLISIPIVILSSIPFFLAILDKANINITINSLISVILDFIFCIIGMWVTGKIKYYLKGESRV